jgi:streptomycin 6-kinase
VIDRAALAALGVDDAMVAERRRLDGDGAVALLASLPDVVARRQRELGLTGARIMAGGALSAVLACTRVADRRAVVLKLTAGGSRSEAAALALWDGDGAPALLATSDDGAALVLDAIEPGGPADPTGRDAEDAGRAAALLARLRRDPAVVPPAIPAAVVPLAWRFERARSFVEDGRAFAPVALAEIDAAAAAAARLDRTTPSRYLCHGDFLSKNILLDRAGGWRAIDPMPCIGDPCLDAGFWALHHRPGTAVGDRCDLVARDAGLEADRVRAWARAFAASEAALDNVPDRAAAHLRALRG